MQTQLPGTDHLTRLLRLAGDAERLRLGLRSLPDPERRHIRNGRDLAEWVHIDVLFQAYFRACLILGSPPEHLRPGDRRRHRRAAQPRQPLSGLAQPGRLHQLRAARTSRPWCARWPRGRSRPPGTRSGRSTAACGRRSSAAGSTTRSTSNRYPGVLHRDILESKVVDRVLSQNGTGLLPHGVPRGVPDPPLLHGGPRDRGRRLRHHPQVRSTTRGSSSTSP